MNVRITMVLIALIGVGLYALPQTMALFSGQHSFYNIDATGNQIPCTKCHGDVQAELQSAASTITGTPGAHAAFKCEYCHRIEAGASSGDNAYALVTYKNGSSMRTIAISVEDFESHNFPETVINNELTLANATGGFVFKQGAQISPIVIGTESDASALPLYNEYLKPTYNSATGQPYDTSANRLGGLKLNRLGQANATDWTWGSRYWTPTLLNGGSKVVTEGTNYHAASIVSCLECHGGVEPFGHYSRVLDGESTASCEGCHYSASSTYRWTELAAGGFGLTNATNPEDTGIAESHNEFVKTDDGITRYASGASNGACIACHTHVAVDITYTKPTTLTLDATFGTDGTETLGGQTATGSAISRSDGTTP